MTIGKRVIRRSTKQWLLRAIFAVAAVLTAWFSVRDTLANVVVKIDAERAHELAPWDGQITATMAQSEMDYSPSSDRRSLAAKLAHQGLSQDPTAVEALDVLALQAQLRGNTASARSIFNHSLALSRRELQPHIWAIEEAVSRGDIATALQEYDVALRTSRQARAILFPVLASAIAEPKIRTALVECLKKESAWRDRFIRYVGAGKIDAKAAMLFYLEGGKAGLPIGSSDRVSIVNALYKQGDYSHAWQYYRTFRPAVMTHSRDANFSAKIQFRTVFDWRPYNRGGLSSSIQQGRDSGMLEFAAAPSVGGVVLEQHQVFPSGTYSFESNMEEIDQRPESQPYWLLKCRGGRELGRFETVNSEKAEGSVTGRFSVPPDCPVQILSFVLRSSTKISGVYGRVTRAMVSPIDDRPRKELIQ